MYGVLIYYTRKVDFLKRKKMNIKWTEEEKEFIRQNAHKSFDSELANELARMSGRKITIKAVRKQRRKLQIKKAPGRGCCKIALN